MLTTAFYQQTADDVFLHFKTKISGLKNAVVADSLTKYGRNILPEIPQKSRFNMLFSQFKDLMVIILIVAAVISFLMGEKTDAVIILIIIIGNAWMGFSQENKAEESIKALQKMAPQFAHVMREGLAIKVETSALVPGDILLLSAGDIVSADARLVEISAFKTGEASLTGESAAVEKTIAPIMEAGVIAGGQSNMVFKGTIVSNGSAKAVITATGVETQLGKIAGMLATASPQTPLQKKLTVFSRQLVLFVLVICASVFVLGLLRGESALPLFLTALALAVAALPEALPAVITIALAGGAKRLVQQNALIRKLPAVETLGSVTYICSDKTGTLTQNVMSVEKIKPAKNQMALLQYGMMLSNEVRFADGGKLLGDPTETALVDYAEKSGLIKAEVDALFPLVKVIPFDSERMRMSTLHRQQDKWILFVKGAPVKIVASLSSFEKIESATWLEQNEEWAKEGLRVLFLAYKIFDHKPDKLDETIESDLNFLGAVAMIDPPRNEVIAAISECHKAGIKTMMITGDQPLTAMAIASRLGMLVNGDATVKTGAELSVMTDAEFESAVDRTRIFARVSPHQKLSIVKTLQQKGEFVAMTGDGVNDSPSLKQADIGVAMGITGTDVSKQAADMILLDDNFATIVKAVKEGRRIYDNILKFIIYILSCNLAEILTIFFAPIIGFAIPLLPIHILWINLVTDGLPGIALVGEPASEDIMKRPPLHKGEKLFSQNLIVRTISTGVIMTICILLMQWWAKLKGFSVPSQQTMVFSALCFMQLLNALSIRSTHPIFYSKAFFSNGKMWLVILLTALLQTTILSIAEIRGFFKLAALTLQSTLAIVIACAVFFTVIELLKYMRLMAK